MQATEELSELRTVVGSPAWKALETHYMKARKLHLRKLFADDPKRGERLTASAAGIELDYSKNRITDETLELLFQLASTVAAHDQENRPTPEQIQANYAIDQAICEPVPQVIGLFDDVLTTGAHFRAASTALQQSFSGVKIVGLFIARRVPEAADIEDGLNADAAHHAHEPVIVERVPLGF